jgi:hypothetical protein
VVEVSRQIRSSTSEASVCLQPLSHEDEAVLLAPVSKKVVSDTRDAQGMTRLNRQTSSLDDWDGNSFPYMVENVIESTPFFAEGFHQAGKLGDGGNLGTGKLGDGREVH